MKRLTLMAPVAAVVLTLAGCATPAAYSPQITMARFLQLETGMSYQAAVDILGRPGEESGRSEFSGTTTIIYTWKNSDFSNMNATFQNDKMVSKGQFGLK